MARATAPLRNVRVSASALNRSKASLALDNLRAAGGDETFAELAARSDVSWKRTGWACWTSLGLAPAR